ncbi:HTH_Tnp_Tc3_2 domain-containing protein [Trichonephila clavipes]|nr:HTH_Tnp_Tc3_2 domain-containing protein [Trichonephila clavipes]
MKYFKFVIFVSFLSDLRKEREENPITGAEALFHLNDRGVVRFFERHPVPSRETIRRRLTEVGLRSRRPLRRLPLTPHHRQCRLDFCRPRATWSVTDWRRVIFSDESR